MRGRVLAVYLSICVLWGSTWSVNAVALRDVPPLLLVGVRSALAATMLAPFALRELAGMSWRWVTAIAILQLTIPYGLMFVAQQWTPSSLAAVLFATFPVWMVLLARLFLPGEALTRRRLAGAVLGIAGVAVLQLPAFTRLDASARVALGGALIVVASVVSAAANVLVRRRPHAIRPLALTFAQAAIAAVALLAASALFERDRSVTWSPFALGAVVYLAAFGTVATYAGLYWLAPRVSVSAIGAIPLVDTTVAVALGALVLREHVGWNLAAGATLVLSAVALEAAGPSREPRRDVEPSP
jgi:drug/metabolite transporter (DMT)-like permease